MLNEQIRTPFGAGEMVINSCVQAEMSSADPVTGTTRRSHRRVIMTTCRAHSAAGFTNLLVTKEDGVIVLNPHIANCCVLQLNQQAATALRDVLGEWLGELVLAVNG